MARYCVNCGKELNESDNVCSNCGTRVEGKKTYVNQVSESSKTNGFAVAGFVLALLSFFCCGSTSVLGLVFSIVGLVNSKKYNDNGKGLAIAGIAISCVGVLILVILNIFIYVGGYSYSNFSTYYY